MSGADTAQPAPNPYAWLWAEISRRFGADAAADLHADYLAESRAYNRRRWHEPPDPTPTRPRATRPRRSQRPETKKGRR